MIIIILIGLLTNLLLYKLVRYYVDTMFMKIFFIRRKRVSSLVIHFVHILQIVLLILPISHLLFLTIYYTYNLFIGIYVITKIGMIHIINKVVE